MSEYPACFNRFVCLDYCVVSCPFWEECIEEADDEEEEAEEAEG